MRSDLSLNPLQKTTKLQVRYLTVRHYRKAGVVRSVHFPGTTVNGSGKVGSMSMDGEEMTISMNTDRSHNGDEPHLSLMTVPMRPHPSYSASRLKSAEQPTEESHS